MASDTHPIPAHCPFAPDASAAARSIDEQPPASWVAATTKAIALEREREHRGQQVLRDAVPTIRRRTDGSIRLEAEIDDREQVVQAAPPVRQLQAGIVRQRSRQRAQIAEAAQLPLSRLNPRVGDRMAHEERDGVRRSGEVVVRRFAGSCATAIVRARAVQAVREAERSIRAEDGCNGIHRL
jgi:hypothetical protein